MAILYQRKKALAVRPVKSSQPVGAALAFQGMDRAIPLLHGSQGCTAFAKVFFVRHFREPIPLQTTAMDQVSTVMGGDDNILEALKTISSGSRPGMIGLITTGLTEIQGSDIRRVVKTFREQAPTATDVVPVACPDFTGCLETGYARAVEAMIDTLVAESGPRESTDGPPRVTLLPGAHLTPGDVEALKEMVAAFGLQPVAVPDLSLSLDGHLEPGPLTPLSPGGTPAAAVRDLATARATLVFGDALGPAADLLRRRTGVADYRFPAAMGLKATDRLLTVLGDISGQPVPESLRRDRQRLLDAMLDTHFFLTHKRVGLAGDPDFLLGWRALLGEMGLETPAVVASMGGEALLGSDFGAIQIGDLEDLEDLAVRHGVDLLLGNSHVAELAERLDRPVLRCGYPVHDRLGMPLRSWVGYRGGWLVLFDLVNTLTAHDRQRVAPYRSVFPLAAAV
ncbi:MAG: nitrogenase iron-molybdenum cofactor biosynthesis protein NifN [Magnetococcales bacterium]|nr:nitrogenase iron-molybdenum cofactor biosynthesis protein NifN [Magnetococcales bacterium]